jgi:preprotein translocase subunit Sss1
MKGGLSFPETTTVYVDILLWKTFKGSLLPVKNLAVGIKHGIGLIATGGHSMKLDSSDDDMQYLSSLIDRKSLGFYRDIFAIKTKLYQILYKDGIPSDPDCIHEDTRHIPESAVSPIYENYHILRLYPKLAGADYYGVTSWRMKEKTGLTKKLIDEFIQSNKANAYVYYQCGGGHKNALLFNISSHTDIGNAVQRIIELKVFKNPDRWVDVYANFWVADKPTWDRYIPVLKRVLALCEADGILKKLLDKKFAFRDKQYPLTCFALEYIFGLFLADNPDIAWKQIK